VSDDSDPSRDAIHACLQQQGVASRPGALLTGWAVVTQWVDPDGETWLARGHSATIPYWGAKGLWHEALYGDWPEPDDDL
jgi:hypothetical protein